MNNNNTVHIAYGIFDYAFKAPQVKMLGAFAKPENALACIQAKLNAAEADSRLKVDRAMFSYRGLVDNDDANVRLLVAELPVNS
jgi:hypothetical protein